MAYNLVAPFSIISRSLLRHVTHPSLVNSIGHQTRLDHGNMLDVALLHNNRVRGQAPTVCFVECVRLEQLRTSYHEPSSFAARQLVFDACTEDFASQILNRIAFPNAERIFLRTPDSPHDQFLVILLQQTVNYRPSYFIAASGFSRSLRGERREKKENNAHMLMSVSPSYVYPSVVGALCMQMESVAIDPLD